jgi:hypothetical protein
MKEKLLRQYSHIKDYFDRLESHILAAPDNAVEEKIVVEGRRIFVYKRSVKTGIFSGNFINSYLYLSSVYCIDYRVHRSTGMYEARYKIISDDFDFLNSVFSSYVTDFEKQYGAATRNSRVPEKMVMAWHNQSNVTTIAIVFIIPSPPVKGIDVRSFWRDNPIPANGRQGTLSVTWSSPLPQHRILVTDIYR